MRKTWWILLGLGAVYIYMKNKPTSDKRAALISKYPLELQFRNALTAMSPPEISDVYDYVTNYIEQRRQLEPMSALYGRIQVISSKYNIFN